VIVTNHSEWRSDILILYDALLSLIPTFESFYDEGNKLRDDLLDARKKRGLDSTEYHRALASVLQNLYNLVGRPVIDRLRMLNIPEQSRIWWCPTSVFCSLPLHAMGPALSNDGVQRYFSDLYIPSYTPTLSALIDSRNPGPQLQSSRQPSLLRVAHPDGSLPGVKGEIKVIQALKIEVKSPILKDATTTTVPILRPLTTMSSATPSKRKLSPKRPRPLPTEPYPPGHRFGPRLPVSPPAAPPAKRSKPAPPSPPAPGPPPPPSVREMEEDGPSVFDVLNVFRRRWFLNRDHLLANILSAQKDDAGHIIWVDFLPPFHTHLVRWALALLCKAPKSLRLDLSNSGK